MTSINLTHTEAAARSAMLRVSHYSIDLDLTGPEFFRSRTVVDFEVTAQGSTFIDLRADELHSVRLNGAPLPTQAYDPKYGIPLSGMQVGTHRLEVDATIAYSRTGQGLHRFVDPVDEQAYLYTQFETADAKRVFACFDQPDLKATYSLRFTAPKEWTIITNGPVTEEESTGQARVWSSEIDYQLSTYLVALCAGPYVGVSDEWTGTLSEHPENGVDTAGTPLRVPLGIYCRPSLLKSLDHERLFAETKQGFDWYHRNFGFPYPFGKYDQIFVPEFNAGAMENAGCVTIRDEYVFTSQATHFQYERRADTVLHELAHMWFGDLVTMQWWDDLWLNESFATWASAISQAEETEYDTAWVTFANVEKSWAYEQDLLPSTHPVSTDASDIETVEQNFDGITYAKGASVLKQLQAYVGRENFLAGVRRHFAAHAWGNATFSDLLRHLEEASGRDLSFWADQWLKTTGVNTLKVELKADDQGVVTAAELVQSGAQVRTHRVAVGVYNLVNGKVERTQRIEMDIDSERADIPQLVGKNTAELGFILPNDDDLSYAFIELDAQSLEFMQANIDKFTDAMARTLCWSTAWQMTRGAAMRARDFVALVARGAQAETELAVLERILAQATTAQTTYADPQWAAADTTLVEAVLAGTKDSNPERAIIFEKALGNLVLNDSARAHLNGVLETSDDSGLRWRALTALVADGVISAADAPARIAAELERDNTALNVQNSLKALAAMNTADNKAGVWELIMRNADEKLLGNRDLESKILGFSFTGSDEVLLAGGYTQKFFEQALDLWEKQSSEVALETVTGLYPLWDVSAEALAAADAFLAGELPGGLRRAVSEQRARVARALDNRTFDAS